MGFRAAIVAFLASVMGLLSCLTALPAYALTPVEITDLSYTDCPAEYEGMVTPGSITEATCYLIKGTAINKSGKPVLNADVFGRIYDANNNPVMQNRNRIGSIDYIPPGESPFEFRVSVASNQSPPLKLEQFKASGFAGKVRR